MPVYSSYSRFADVYDGLMRDVPYDAWAAYLAELLRTYAPEAHTLADCACGTGAISIRLARMGYAVTGVDASPDMLRVAQQNARLAGLQLPFVCQDMRALRLHKPVDAIVCACDGVNYLLTPADVQAFFRAAHAALRPGGALLFDVSSAYKLEHVLGSSDFTETSADCAYIWANRFIPKTRCVEMDLTFFAREPDGRYARFDELHVQRAHTGDELRGALAETGFETAAVYAAFGREAPAPESERLQIVALRT